MNKENGFDSTYYFFEVLPYIIFTHFCKKLQDKYRWQARKLVDFYEDIVHLSQKEIINCFSC